MAFPLDGFENPNLVRHCLDRIAEAAAGRGFNESLARKLLDGIEAAFAKGAADPDAALIALERFFTEADSDLKWVLEKNRLSRVINFFGYCELLTQHALKYPDQLRSALEKSEQAPPDQNLIAQELEKRLAGANSFEELSRSLRAFKNEQYLRLAVAELSVPDRLDREIKEVSWIAEAGLELGLARLLRLHREKKIPGAADFPEAPICVLGMGKLGGGELNFSSDIDLIYICPNPAGEAEETRQGKLAALAEQLTRLLSEITEQGFIFRVDLRLRPGGDAGPLVNSFDAALDYYLNFGRNWERAAFIRARPLAGNVELGKKFLAELDRFIFRRNHDFASFEDLKQLKVRIDREARKQAGQDGFAGYDLKLGPGGIREIEFFSQALQLIYAGKHPQLKIGNTMQALQKLKELNLAKEKDVEDLSRAWHFLRQVEHRVQLKNLRQDHRIPKNKRGQETLARSFGFLGKDGREKFAAELKRHSQTVAEIFSGLFGEEPEDRPSIAAGFLSWDAQPEELAGNFKQMGFAEPDLAAESWLRILAPLRRAERAPKLLAVVLPRLLQEIAASSEPDLALLQLERFLAKTGASAAFLSLLKDHPAVHKLLTELFSTSEFLGNLFISYPELLDELVSPHALAERSPSELEAELETDLHSAADYEDKLSRLRLFQKLELLRTGLKDLSGQLEIQALEQKLTTLAEIILEQSYKVSWDELVGRHGRPGRDETGGHAGLLVLGLGKLGSREMSWASDLDLIFIYQGQGATDGKQPLEVHEFFIRLCQKIISTLQTPTAQGLLYAADTRLRPSGTHGPLVVSVDSFEEYHRAESQVWEKQALIKARPLIDGAGIRDKVMAQIEKGIYQGNDPSRLKQEMRRLLARVKDELAGENENLYDIKFGGGGEMELDYIVQFLQLMNGGERPELRAGGTWAALDALKQLEIITGPEYLSLKDALWFYRRLGSRMRIYRDRPEHQLRLAPGVLDRLAKKAGVPGADSGEKLVRKLDQSRQSVHDIFLKYIGE